MSITRTRPRRGLFAFSADPITNGHLEVIAEASAECDHLIVAVMNNDAKKGKYLFSAEERVKIARKAIEECGFGNVSVIVDEGLLTDLFLREGCDKLYRGVRNEEDLRYEKAQVVLLDLILPGIEDRTRMIMTGKRIGHISSTAVKLFASYNADVAELVPAFVKAELERRVSKQIRIGITGGIAVGKTTVAQGLARQLGHHVNVDELVRELYREDGHGAQRLRDEIERVMGPGVLAADRRDVNRSVMAERLFAPTTGPAVYDEITRLTAPHVDRKYREALKDKEGVIIVEWAQMAEMRMSHWVNHRVIVVDSPDRERFAEKRGIAPEQLARVRAKQWSADRKAEALAAAGEAAKYGRVLAWENRWRDDEAGRKADLAALVDQVMAMPGLKTPGF